jgi:hypothetical protein
MSLFRRITFPSENQIIVTFSVHFGVINGNVATQTGF